jgi:hypothetical protein
VNALDVVIVATVTLSGLAGWRFGFAARAFAWCGVALVVAIGLPYLSRVVTNFGGTSTDGRATVAVIYIAVLAVFGQAVGLGVGLLVHRMRRRGAAFSHWNRGAGAAIGVAGVVLIVWLLPPSVALTNSWLSRAGQDSAVVGFVEAHTPAPPSGFAVVGRIVADAPRPRSERAPAPPEVVLSPDVDAGVRRAMVEVEATDCRDDEIGSGWFVAADLIVTSAHVVAHRPVIHVNGAVGHGLAAHTVALSDRDDLALLRVDGTVGEPLPRSRPTGGATGAVYGYAPGRLMSTSARVFKTKGDDIIVSAGIDHGDSGGPLVGLDGSVMGVVYAFSGRTTAYAVSVDRVTGLLASVHELPVEPRRCP